jgi:hypothetical protein
MTMTMPSTAEAVVVSPAATTNNTAQSYVDWPAIFAGIVLASAIALVLLTFGSAIGLSFANFHGGTGVSPVWIGIAAASWLLWVEVSSMMCGGYLTGRMRRRVHDATEHESDVRDGAHGLIVWGGALIIGAVVAISGIGAGISAVSSVAGTATMAAASAAGPAAGEAASKGAFDPTAYFADALFRPAAAPATAAATTTAPAAGDATAAAATTPAPAAVPTNGAAPAMAMGNAADRTVAVAEAGRILTNDALTGSVTDADKAYLADLVAHNTGMTADESKKRVDDIISQIDTAKQKAADAAETARKMTVLAAFITAASLLVAAVAAYWAAMMGGNHRDKEMVFDYWFRRF